MASRLKRRFTAHAAILMYHRIADLATDPQLLAITPGNFAEHLDVIRSRYRPMRLSELAAALATGHVPDRAVVVTLDDGYADNLHNARPLLERHGVPATIFVASGYVSSGRQFWWDELESLVLRPGSLPPILSFSAGRERRRYDVDLVHYSVQDFDRHRAWHVERHEEPTSRHRLYRRLYEDLYRLSAGERATALEELRASGAGSPRADSADGPLDKEQLITLANSSLVDIGAHSVTHAVLPQLSLAAQRHEIEESRRFLERILDRPVTTFGYPHGRATADTVRLVREAGFSCAGGSEAGTVTARSDRFQLPRMLVRDSSGEHLGRRLHEWLGG